MKLGIIRTLTTLGSIISIGFGVWHFFIPEIWNWYSYIDKNAPELIIAIRAINIFFSLLLVLIGIANILFVFRKKIDKYSCAILLLLNVILWTTRLLLQVIYPQGSENPYIQYSMPFLFSLVWLCFLISFGLTLKRQGN